MQKYGIGSKDNSAQTRWFDNVQSYLKASLEDFLIGRDFFAPFKTFVLGPCNICKIRVEIHHTDHSNQD